MKDVCGSAVPRDVAFPAVKQEVMKLEDGTCLLPQALTFPTIKDEVIDDDELEYVWWDLKPDKEQLDFAVIKDEYIDYDYQARERIALDQDRSLSNGSEEENQYWCDDLPASHGRLANRFVIDSDPEELDESLYRNIAFNRNDAEAEVSIWDCSTMYEECGNDTKQEEVTIDEVITHSDAQIKSESNIEHILLMEMDPINVAGNSTEDVIVIDDDDEDDHMVNAYGSDTTSVNDGKDNYDIIVIDDEDDDDNFVNDKCQQENYEIENDHNSDESPVEVHKTTAKKRKRKQDKNKIKCLVLFDGQETRRIPVNSKCKSKRSSKSCQKKVSHTRRIETAEDEIQETNVTNSMQIDDRVQQEVSKDGGDMFSPKTINESASFGKAEYANKLETTAGGCGEYLANTTQRCVYSTGNTHKIKSSMRMQQQCSNSMQGLKEFDKSEQDMKQYMCAPKIRKRKSVQNMEQYKSTLEMKQSGTYTQERTQPSTSAQERMQPGTSAQEKMQCSSSAQERMQHGTSSQERMQCGMSSQERMQHGTYSQERMPHSMSSQERMQHDKSAQEGMQHYASTQERMQHDVSAQERMQHDVSAQEKMQNDASTQERMQNDASTQERMQHDASTQEKMQYDAYAHERMQYDAFEQEKMQRSSYEQERIQHSASAQVRMKRSTTAQERIKYGTITQKRMHPSTSAQERMHPNQSVMGEKQCSTSLQDLKMHRKPVEKIQQYSKLLEIVEQCRNSTHIKENGIKSSFKNLQKHDEGNESCDSQKSKNLLQKLLQNLIKYVTELELESCTHTQSVKPPEVNQTANTSQENTESSEGLLNFNQSIKVLQKCIASLQRSSKFTELKNSVQQGQASVDLQKGKATLNFLLRQCVWLLDKLSRCHHGSKEVQSSKMLPTESRQIQSAASNAQPHDQPGIDFVGCENPNNLQHLNQHMNSQFIDLTNESAKISHQINASKCDKQQIDHAAGHLENVENSFHSSRPSETALNKIPNEIPAACKLCSKHFKSHKGVKSHIKRMHRDVIHRYCVECQQDFFTLDLLRNHYECQHFKQGGKKSGRQVNQVRYVTMQKPLVNKVYVLSSGQKWVLNKGHKVCIQQNVNVQYHKKPSIALNEVQKNRQQQVGDTADQHHMHSCNSHVISMPASLQSNTTTPHSQPASLQSSITATNSRAALSQSSPSTSPSKPVPLPPCPASLKLRYARLQTSPSHEHLNHQNTPFDSIATPQTNHAPLRDEATYKQKIVQTRIRNVQLPKLAPKLPIVAANLKTILLTQSNDHHSFFTSQTDNEVHANRERYLNGGVPNDTQLHKGDTLHTVLETGADIVWQKEINASYNSVSFTDDFGSENAERQNSCDNSSNVTRANVTGPFVHNRNHLSIGATHNMNYNHPQSMHHPGMHIRANESCRRYNGFNPQYIISKKRLPDIPNFRQEHGYFMKKTSNLQPIRNLYNCKRAPCHDSQSTSSVCETVFTTNVTQVPAGLLEHDSVHGIYSQNLSNTMSNNVNMHVKHMSQPVIDLARQPVIVANYNTVTYVQNNIPCVL